MTQTFKTAFQTCCTQLLHARKGRADEVLAEWEKRADLAEHPLEDRYVHAWCAAVAERWEQGKFWLLVPEVQGAERYRDTQNWTPRRWSSALAWLLGTLARQLGRYEEASNHYRLCIRLVSERRMGNVELEIQARSDLATCELRAGSFAAARREGEESLRLCSKSPQQGATSQLYATLAEACYWLKADTQAVSYGELALQNPGSAEQEGHVCLLLGRAYARLGDFQNAARCYTTALTIARREERIETVITVLVALADIERERGELKAAWPYCRQALDMLKRVSDPALLGAVFLACGKVTEAWQMEDVALAWYKKAQAAYEAAEDTQQLAVVYQLLADLLIRMKKPEQARTYVKLAAQVVRKIRTK